MAVQHSFEPPFYSLFTVLLKPLLSLYFSIEISNFPLLFYWNLYFLFTFPLKSLPSLYFTFWTLPYFQTCATCYLSHLMTELFNCELPFDFSTTWLSYSIVSYLLISLPLDWAIQLWATSWLLYHLTALFKCELPLDYPTTWLSYSSVSYLLLYHLTELFKCELPLDYSTTWLSYSSVSCLLITLPLDWASSS